jgi:hypothetical protein
MQGGALTPARIARYSTQVVNRFTYVKRDSAPTAESTLDRSPTSNQQTASAAQPLASSPSPS